MEQKSLMKNYAFTFALLVGVIIGGVCGAIFGEGAEVVRPIGEIYLNMMFVMIVPLVLFSISTAFYRLKKSRLAGRILWNMILVFLLMSVIAAVSAYALTLFYNPLTSVDRTSLLTQSLIPPKQADSSIGDIIVNTFTVNDFVLLFNKSNLLPLIIFAMILGLSIPVKEDFGAKVEAALDAGLKVTVSMVRIVMFLAPVGLGCYFAFTVGRLGGQILEGYVAAFILFLILAALGFFVLNTVYVWLSYGWEGVRIFWKNILTPALAAISTSSSAFCMPINISTAIDMGVPKAVAETVIPIGTNIHKDGSVMGGILKVVFLLTFFGQSINSAGDAFMIIGVALLVGVVMAAVPTGGMVGELLICSIFGYPPQMAAVLMVISTIIDVPATLLNSTDNIVASIMIGRLMRKRYSADDSSEPAAETI